MFPMLFQRAPQSTDTLCTVKLTVNVTVNAVYRSQQRPQGRTFSLNRLVATITVL